MATNRLRYLIAALAAVLMLAVSAPAFAASPQVHVRVEGGSGTLVWNTVRPFTGTVQGHALSTPTALGALITATGDANVPLGLEWFDCCGFFVNSINGRPGTPTSGWAFKVGNTLAQTGAGATPATNGQKVLFYFTKFDPVTFATQPTLSVSDNASKVKQGGTVTVKVRAYNDAGQGTLQPGAAVFVGNVQVGTTDSTGVARVKLTTKGRFQVRATFPSKIRSQRLWLTVS